MRTRWLLASVIGSTLLLAAPAAAAPAPGELGSAQLDQIKQNCAQMQVSLRNLQKRDTILRINRGRLYDLTLRQTGAFVARLDANKVDAPEIKQRDSAIRAEFQRFMADYDHYAESLDQAVKANCSASPAEFYDALNRAAGQRKTVGEDVATIKQQIGEYSAALTKLRDDKFPSGGQQ